MDLLVRESRDAGVIADINRTVQDIHEERYPEYFKPYCYKEIEEEIKKAIRKENWYSYVAWVDDVPAGYVLFFIKHYDENPFRRSYNGIHVDQICITAEYQRMNIGTLLMKKVEDFAIERKMDQIELTYWDENLHAREFYREQGFEEKTHFAVKRLK